MDPITQTYRALWAALVADAQFAALLGPNHRQDLSADSFVNVPQGALGPAQLPQVVLLQGDFVLSPFGRNALVAEVQQSFILAAVTDGLKLPMLNQIKYRTLAALAGAGPTLGLAFVRDYVMTQASDQANQVVPLFAKTGSLPTHWSAVMEIQVNLSFDRSEL